MRYRAWVLSVTVAALLAAPAMAEEIIYFTNGTSLAIRGHKVTEGMIHVDMGDDAFIGFPMSMVERIEEAGRDVYVPPSSTKGLKTNQMLEGATKSTTPRRVTSHYMRDPKAQHDYRDKKGSDVAVEVDKNGMAYIRAYPNQGGARAKMQVTGRQTAAAPNTDPRRGLVGTRRLGTSQLLGEVTPEQSRGKVTLVQPTLKPEKPIMSPQERESKPTSDDSRGQSDGQRGDSSGSR